MIDRHARLLLLSGALAAATGVALGAYGAHALKAEPVQAALFQTALQYHLFHALGLFAVGGIAALVPGARLPVWSGAAMLAGILFFCGTLYASAFGFDHGLRAAAPAGGLAFIGAWLLLALVLLRR